MMTPRGAQRAVDRMSLMKFFPADPGARAILMEDLGGICATDEEADWLARRALDLCPEWPGVKPIWQIYFSKYSPRNERQRSLDQGCCSTELFPEGVPSEREMGLPQLGSGRTPLQITGSRDPVAPVDPIANQVLAEVVEASTMPPLPKYYARTPEEIRVHELLRRMHNESVESEKKSV